MRKNQNKSFYHYSVEEVDAKDNVVDVRFYMTMREMEAKFQKSRITFHRCPNDPNRRIKALPNLKFKRVHIPVYKQVTNDVFSPSLVAEFDSDPSDEGDIDKLDPLGILNKVGYVLVVPY